MLLGKKRYLSICPLSLLEYEMCGYHMRGVLLNRKLASENAVMGVACSNLVYYSKDNNI